MANNKRQATEEELWEALNEPHNDGAFERKLALAIIRANPSSSSMTERQRMNTALKALLGDRYVADRKYSNVHGALKWMAERYVDDHGGERYQLGSRDPYAWLDQGYLGARTVEKLAMDATKAVKDAPTAEYLETEFGRRRRELCATDIDGSDIPGSLHLQTLKLAFTNDF